MNTQPACLEADPEVFASGHPLDHAEAKRFCESCPAAMFALCGKIRDGLKADGYTPVGTWAGKHYGGTRKFRVGVR